MGGCAQRCEAQLRSAAPALVELEVPVRLGLGRVESGHLVELEGVLGVEFEIGLGRAAGGREGRRCGGQVEVPEDDVYRLGLGEEARMRMPPPQSGQRRGKTS